MDDQDFDAFARAVARRPSRRGLLRAITLAAAYALARSDATDAHHVR